MSNLFKNNNNEPKEYNYGLAILKIWMCFEVIIVHFMDWNGETLCTLSLPMRTLLRYCGLAVPIFMLSSFTLTDMSKLSKDNAKLKHRFYRLLLPHFFWAFVYFGVYTIIDKWKGLELEHGISDLLWQLALGHSINQTEWFQIEIIVLTMLFVIIFRFLSKQNALKTSFLICLFALFIQYSGKNGHLFDNVIWAENFHSDYVTYPIGRFCEMIPYAVIGIMLCNSELLNILRKQWIFTVFISFLMLCWLFKYDVFSGVEPQYGYAGLRCIVPGTVSVILFYSFPLHWLPARMKSFIRFLSKYTMAVYFIHRLIATLLYNTQLNTLLGLRTGSLYDCTIIFIICILVAWLIHQIPIKMIKDTIA